MGRHARPTPVTGLICILLAACAGPADDAAMDEADGTLRVDAVAEEGAGAQSPAGAAALEAEAAAFMDAYAADLLRGDVDAVIGRYADPAHVVVNGAGGRAGAAEFEARYRGGPWTPPASFVWQDLRYDALGADAVLVEGTGIWTPAGGGEPMPIDYVAVLERQGAELRIRLEHERFARPGG